MGSTRAPTPAGHGRDHPAGGERSARAAAMPPEDRRAAIVAAAMPLVLARGTGVTTRQIAEAAGIAEGTIFRVFPDKDSLLDAVLDAALDPSARENAIATIDRTQPLEPDLADAVGLMQQRVAELWRLVSALAGSEALHRRRRARRPGPVELPALAELCAEHRDELCEEPGRAARILRSLTLALSHPVLSPDEPLSPEEITHLFLHGAGRHPAPGGGRSVAGPTRSGAPPC